MRVIVWPANDDASAWYRLKFPAGVLASGGLDVVIDTTGPITRWDRPWSGDTAPYDAVVTGLETTPDADVIVVNRPARAHWAEIIPHLQAVGVRVVVDVDDDFSAIPIGNAARATYRQPRCNGRWLERACLLADLVTVSTPDLAQRYAPHGRFAVLPNLVPSWYLDVEHEHRNTIGWSGKVATHPGDLETVGGAVAQTLAQHEGWSFTVVGPDEGAARCLGLETANSTGWLPLAEYPAAMASIGIGIVPLGASRFNRSKSALKMAELAALGVPVVASPTPDNRRLHGFGVGLLASNPPEWRGHLSRLIGDNGYRDAVGARGREVMRSQTYKQRANLWADAWRSALDRRAVA